MLLGSMSLIGSELVNKVRNNLLVHAWLSPIVAFSFLRNVNWAPEMQVTSSKSVWFVCI